MDAKNIKASNLIADFFDLDAHFYNQKFDISFVENLDYSFTFVSLLSVLHHINVQTSIS